MNNWICSSCGSQNAAEMNFCLNCGQSADLSKSTDFNIPPTVFIPPTQKTSYSQNIPNTATSSPGKSFLWVWLGLGGLVVIGGVLVVGVFIAYSLGIFGRKEMTYVNTSNNYPTPTLNNSQLANTKTASTSSYNSNSVNTSVANNRPTSNTNSSAPQTISGGVINGKAINLPKPPYPATAKAVNASGAVNVQVEVDENGNVVSAKSVNGHPLLRVAAEQAARQAKFSPTVISGRAVKIDGIIVYNFVPE